MTKKSTIQKQKGFAVIELVLFIVILVALGGIGWYVVSSNHKTQSQLDKLAQTSGSSASTMKSKFVFKELGVQITLPNSLKGLTYDVDTTYGYNYLTSDQFKTALKDCGSDTTLNNSSGSFASLLKKSGEYPAEPTIDDGQLLKQFQSFYIGMGVPNGLGCDDTTKAEQLNKVAHDLQAAIAEAFKTATLVQ